MFVCVSHASPSRFPESGSLKAKRQVLRRVTDRVKARFNVAVAEVEDNDLWQKASIALSRGGQRARATWTSRWRRSSTSSRRCTSPR